MVQPALILASRSPRRAQLLRQAGYSFSQIDPPFADPPQPEMGDPMTVTLDLSRRKARSLMDSPLLDRFRGRGRGGCVILAADTVCVGHDGQLLGQPKDREDARTMIRSFLGYSHQVISAVCLMGVGETGKETRFADAATVTMGQVATEELELYLDTNQWRGKAGGYNLFDRQEAGWPIQVEGAPATVMGLPMRRLVAELKAHSIFSEKLPGELPGMGEHGSQSETIQA